MAKSENFDFKWKLVENYSAAITATVFLFFFVDWIVNGSQTSFFVSVAMILVAPFLITFVDKKSTRSN